VVQGGCRRLLPQGEALADAGVVGNALYHRPYQRTHDRRRKLSIGQEGVLGGASRLATLRHLLYTSADSVVYNIIQTGC